MLRRDTLLLAVLADHGWRPEVSGFELTRGTADMPTPVWPPGLTTTGLDVERDGPAAHDLAYRRAAWADVVGHHHRPYDEWRGILVHET